MQVAAQRPASCTLYQPAWRPTSGLLPASLQGTQQVLLIRCSGRPGVHVRAASEGLDTAAAAVSSAAAAVTDAAASAAPVAEAVVKKSGTGLLEPLTDGLEWTLRFLQSGLDAVHVPYSYGYSIILLTLIVKVATYPLTKQQIESALAVQSLKPRVDLIKARYGDDKDKVSKETNRLYEEAGVNPLAGCLPTLATIPIFIGLYSSLTNAANAGLFDSQGFYWLPSLAGPTSIAERQAGAGTDWLFPFVDGAPPVGWEEASAYLVLPVLLVLTQWLSTALTAPPMDPDDPNATTSKALYVALPLMIGWFSLNVPSGLTLYYFSNTVLTTAVQLYLKKLGGATVNVKDLGPVTKPGSGRRSGPVATNVVRWESAIAAELAEAKAKELAADDEEEEAMAAAAAAAAVPSNGNGNDAASQLATPEQVAAAEAAASSGRLLVRRKKLELMVRA